MNQLRPLRLPFYRRGIQLSPPLSSHRPSPISAGWPARISPGQLRHKSQPTSPTPEELLAKYHEFFKHEPAKPLSRDIGSYRPDERVAVHGFIGKRVRGGDAGLTLVKMTTAEGYEIQLASTSEPMLDRVRAIPPFSPVRVTGTVRLRTQPQASGSAPRGGPFTRDWSLQLEGIAALGAFPSDIIVSDGVRFPPSARHLQLRFHDGARARLELRSALKDGLAGAAAELGYCDVDTPLLFRSTPEGAREFVVPVRGRAGYAYALPQSPQQYKQVLMASGVARYVQFARCFRDEDLRADRQPEFSQMDLERAFADGDDVMIEVEAMILKAWEHVRTRFRLLKDEGGSWTPVPDRLLRPGSLPYPPLQSSFPRLKYRDCIARYGTDKPDLRNPHPIFRFPHNEPIGEFLSKTSASALAEPVMEACAFQLRDDAASPREVRESVARFMDALPAEYGSNPDGAPQVLVFESALPLDGFSSLGHEGYEALTTGLVAAAESEASEAAGAAGAASLHRHFRDGDVVLFQARDGSRPIGGSTRLGELRPLLWNHLGPLIVDDAAAEAPPELRFIWVTDFPMFTRDGGGADPSPGSSGFSSTHHPFTAPRSAEDFALLATDPLAATAEHYDLVLNGVEVGGGSRRIHVAEVQEYVLREVLGLPADRLARFSHLLDALRAGCPPHAGFALGFDRLCAVLAGASSVRDVIAFPKSKKGDDLFAKAPARLTREEWAVYDLEVRRPEPAGPGRGSAGMK